MIIKTILQTPAYGIASGGDKFVLVLPEFNKQQAMDMTETIRSRIKRNIYHQKVGLNVRMSASTE